MTAGRQLIEPGGGNRPFLVSLVHQLHHLIERRDLDLREPFDVDSLSDALPHIEVLVGRLDEVVDALIVDLDVTAVDVEVLARLLGTLEDLLHGERDEANLGLRVAFHGMGLARASLAVRKDSLVDAAHGSMSDGLDRTIKQLVGRALAWKDPIEGVDLVGPLVQNGMG